MGLFNGEHVYPQVSHFVPTRYTPLASLADHNGEMWYDIATNQFLGVVNGTISAFTSGGSVGGSNTQIQFNDNGVLGGSSALTFNKTTGQLTQTVLSGSEILHLVNGSAIGDIFFSSPATYTINLQNGVGILQVGTISCEFLTTGSNGDFKVGSVNTNAMEFVFDTGILTAPTITLGTGTSRGSSSAVVIPLTSAQIKTLHSVPITVLAAPGSGLAYIITQIDYVLNYNTTTYVSSGALKFLYGSTGGANASAPNVDSGFLNSTSSQFISFSGNGVTSTNSLATITNQPIVLTNLTDDPTVGDGTLLITVYYNIVPTA